MREDTETWRRKGIGVKLGDEKRYCIANVRFTDDIMLIAKSLDQLRKMMTDFKRSTKKDKE